MAVAVFDADVLIGYLEPSDPHHTAAVARVRHAVERGARRFLSAVNYAELLIAPLRASGRNGADRVDEMLADLEIEVVPVDMSLGRIAAEVRERTNLTLVDAFPIAAAIHIGRRGHKDVGVHSFDEEVVKAYASHRSAT
ncbi:MAG: PIN domain-containing protein [Actinobacteria bacterium]|nr:PIN domain-containing protein [Actinomycetota bacterium]